MISNQTALTYYVGLLLGFSHWVGCLFLFFAWRETSERSDEAIDGYALTLLGQDEQWTQYVVSIYWALQTTLTVGYGDVAAQNQTWVMMIYSSVIGMFFKFYAQNTPKASHNYAVGGWSIRATIQ